MKPIVRIPIGWTHNDPATRNIHPRLACLTHGWTSPEWEKVWRKYTDLGFDGPLYHYPQGVMMQYAASYWGFRESAKVPGLEKIANKAAFKKHMLALTKRGLHPLNYTGNPFLVEHPDEYLTPEYYAEAEPLMAGNARIVFDAAWVASWGSGPGQVNDWVRPHMHNFMLSLQQDRASTPCLCEAIPSLDHQEFYKFDMCCTDVNFDQQYMGGSRSSETMPTVGKDNWPKTATYILYGFTNPPRTWEQIKEHITRVRSMAPDRLFVPVVTHNRIDIELAAGRTDWSL